MISDNSLRHQITQAAAKAYRARGGTDLPAWADKSGANPEQAVPETV